MRERHRLSLSAASLCSSVLLLAALAASASAAERAMTFGASVHGVEFSGRADVSITLGDTPGVRLQAPQQALLDEYDVEARGGTLIIERRDRSLRDRIFGRNDAERIAVEITLAALDRVEFSGAGELHLDAIRGDRLRVGLSGVGDCSMREIDVAELELSISGAGDCKASGSAARQTVQISGAGDFDAAALESRTVRVVLSGAADASFQVSDELDAAISGAGSITYRGRPAVRQQISGFGSIKQID